MRTRKSANMETKSAKGSSVLLFGLSFNLILTLTSFGFTCYSLNRFDSRLTTVEHDLLATNSPYRHADGVIAEPTSTHSPLTEPQKKNNVAKRAVDNPSLCRKCSACLNLNVHQRVSCPLFITFTYFLWLLPRSKYWPTVLELSMGMSVIQIFYYN